MEGALSFLVGVLFIYKYFPNSVQGANSHGSLALSRGKFSRASKSDGLISYPVLGGIKKTSIYWYIKICRLLPFLPSYLQQEKALSNWKR